MSEEWRKIDHWPYEVSSLGRVRSLSRIIIDTLGRQYPMIGKIRKGTLDKDGYLRVTVSQGMASRANPRVNLLVCKAFHGPQPSLLHEAAHWNGNKLDNTPHNLRWALPVENQADAIRLGEKAKGGRNGSALLTEEQVRKIKQLLNLRLSHRAIGKEFRVTRSTVTAINIKKTWSWLG